MINRINLILQAKNITAKQFAEEIGVQPSGLSHILSGRNNPSLDFVMKVVRRYPEINITWLMFGTGEMYVGSLSKEQPSLETSTPAYAPVTQGAPADLSSLYARPQPRMTQNLEQTVAPNPVASTQAVRGGVSPVDSPMEPSASHQIQFASVSHSAMRGTDNLTLFDVVEPTPSVAHSSLSFSNPARDVPAAGSSLDRRPQTSSMPERPAERVSPVESNHSSAPIMSEISHVDENRANDSSKEACTVSAILGEERRRIKKIVILYDDHSFSEYYPAD